jgi:hypothetical protein
MLLISVVNIFVFNLLQCSFCVQTRNNIVVDVATSFLVFFVTVLQAIYFIYNYFFDLLEANLEYGSCVVINMQLFLCS